MKKIALLVLFSVASLVSYSQVLNQPANWPNANWTISGTYNPSGLINDPAANDSFTFDDDAAGSTSDDDIASESPIIDLTAASAAGENLIIISGTYMHRDIGGSLAVQYWDADGGSWISVLELEGTPSPNDYANCSAMISFEAGFDVSGFTATQLSDFKYRYAYDDADGWQWGWCIQESLIISGGSNPPNCDAVVTAPTNGETGVGLNTVINWNAATGFPEGYLVSIGTTDGGTDIIDNEDVGNVLTYAAPMLAYETTYYVTITPYSGSGNATGCTSSSFTTLLDPSQTIDCAGAPVNIVYCYDNNDTTFWLFTSSDGSPLRINFDAGTIEGFFDDITIYDGVDNNAPVLFNNNAAGQNDLTGLIFDSTGDSLFIEVDSDGSVSCTSGARDEWDFTVSCATCVNPEATYSIVEDCLNGPQFFVDVDLTDIGSATSITISDNQGSADQTTSAIGTFTFGPFANNTDIVITVTNDDDSNCVLSSSSLTQDQCVLNQVDCTQAPLQINYCYGNNDTTTWLFTSTDGSPVRILFNSGTIEGGFDDLTIYDGSDNSGAILFNNNAGGVNDFTGLVFDSTGDSLFLEVDSDGSVSCASGSRLEWDFNVACATCENPVATYAVNEDCINGPQFFVDVDLTDLGSASSITISDNQGSADQTTAAIGTFTFGPFANNTDVVITVTNDDDSNCVLTSSSLTQDQCVLNLVDCAVDEPINIQYCYGNNDLTTWLFTSTDGGPLQMEFNAGTIEGFFDDLTIYDGSDNTGTILFNNNADGINDFTGLLFQSTGDSLFLEVDSDGSVSCASGARLEWDFDVFCATCILPEANYLVVDDCTNGDQFLIDVDVTNIGDAASITISDNQGSAPVQITAAGVTQFGPYPFLTDIIITVTNDDDDNCIINSDPIQLLACPPDNDNCDTATVATVNDNESCDILNPGTIIEATDSGVPTGTCAGNPDDDVWFEFIALNEVQLISIVNITGGTTNLDHAVYEGSCDGLVELYCSGDTASVTSELIVGNTYYVRIFSGGSTAETSTFDLCISEAPDNTICENASNFCSEGDALVTNNIIGLPNNAQVACLGSIPNPSWNVIQIGESGAIEIQIEQNTSFDEDGNPTGTGLDVDFVLWGPFDNETDYCELDLLVDCPTCPNNTANPNFYPFGNIVDCSYDPAFIENVTIENAIAGEIYVLLVTNFSNDPGVIQINTTNSGEDGAGSITADIEADLGVDQDLCGFPDYTITVNSPFADTYEWYQNGILIGDETGDSITVTESDTYTVIVYNEQCDVFAQDEVVVNFYDSATANNVDDIITCDDPTADNIEDFDLEAQNAGILGAQSAADFVITYHETLADAQTGANALASPYTNISNPQTIFVRIEDIDAVGSGSGCFDTTSFDLIISGPIPTATSVDFELCDDISRDGIESFDLDSHSANILNGQDDTIFTVTYHNNQADADSGANPIASPYQNTSNPETLYARVESNQAVDCYSTTDFNLIVNELPLTSFDSSIAYEVCPNATNPIDVIAIAQNYSETEVTINWYQDGGLISGENSLSLPVLVQGLYTIEVTFNTTGCTDSTDVNVIELENCVIPEGISPNGDGLNDIFDLSSYDVQSLDVFNRNGRLVYSKKNYSNEWRGQSNNGETLPVGTYFYVMKYEGDKERAAWVYLNY